MVSHYINKKLSGVLVRRARKGSYVVLKECQEAKRHRHSFEPSISTPGPLQGNSLQIIFYISSAPFTVQKSAIIEKKQADDHLRCKVYEISGAKSSILYYKHFTIKKKVEIMAVCSFGNCVKVTA